MRTVLFIFLLISASKAEKIYKQRCSNSSSSTVTLESTDIEGRYTVELCTKIDKNVIKWQLTLEYKNTEKCSSFELGNPHSHFEIDVTNDSNCTHVCFSTPLDLMFNDCYHIQTSLRNKNASSYSRPHDSVHKITNNLTIENYTGIKPFVSTTNYAKGLVMINWKLGYVPALYYTVDIEDIATSETFKNTCNVSGEFESEVSCLTQLPPGNYKATLKHTAHWTSAAKLFGNIILVSRNFKV